MLKRHFPALSYRYFAIFWVGQFISLIGTWMQSTVQPYLAYRLTNEPIYLGAVGFASSLPALLFGLLGGVIIERQDKRKTVIVMQVIMMAQAFILAFLALTGRITIWHIFVLAFILGLANSLEITARQSMMVELVQKEDLPNAIALNSTIFNAARVLGPSLTAPFLILFRNSGEGWAFFANGVSYLFVIFGLFMIKLKSKLVPRQVGTSVFQDFKEGQAYIRKTTSILLLIFMVAIPSFWGFPLIQMMPVFATNVLKAVGDTAEIVATRNSLILTMQGVGAFFAAVSLAMFSTIRQKGLVLTAGQFVYAIGLICLGFSRTLSQAIPSIILIGWGTVTHLALTNTLIQIIVPDDLRGRVISTYFWVLSGIAPFGSLFLGWLVQAIGASKTAFIGGVICLVGYSAFHLARPSIRQTMA